MRVKTQAIYVAAAEAEKMGYSAGQRGFSCEPPSGLRFSLSAKRAFWRGWEDGRKNYAPKDHAA